MTFVGHHCVQAEATTTDPLLNFVHKSVQFNNNVQHASKATSIAHIGNEILEFPKGFDTLVGERGVTLSGGQKQRTAIARAVIREPRILVLDDALASVDTYTEERILNGLRQGMGRLLDA